VASPTDGRSHIVRLTARGEKLFAKIFPAHLAHLDGAFRALSADELAQAEAVLQRLRNAFESATQEEP
jgi:DNA-binding MarR family transcriptional regulator